MEEGKQVMKRSTDEEQPADRITRLDAALGAS